MTNEAGTKVDAPKPTTPSGRAYVAAAIVAPLAALCTLLPHRLSWGEDASRGLFDRALFAPPVEMHRLAVLAVFALSLGIHELLHALGYVVFGRAPWNRIRVVVRPLHLLFYVTCRVQVTRKAYLRSLLLPAVLLGFVPAVLGLVLGRGWLTFYGFILIVTASGDFHMLYQLRRVPDRTSGLPRA